MSEEDLAFDEWFHSMRGFQTRSEMFYDTFSIHTDNQLLINTVIYWMRSAFHAGVVYQQEQDDNGNNIEV